MKFLKTDGGYVVRFERGERFMEKLYMLAENENINSAFFYGLGGADSARLGMYYVDNKRDYDFKWFAGPLEVTNVTGNIATHNNGLKIHAHATISGTDLNASGGHVEEIICGPTLELFITQINQTLNRYDDVEVGLPLLEL